MPKIHPRIFIFFLIFFTTPFHTIAFQQNESNILKLSQTISFPAIANKTCKDSIFNIFTVSSGLPVSLSLKSGKAKLIGNTITILGAGTVIIEATQSGDAIYDAAVNVSRTFEVTSPFFTLNDLFLVSIKKSICRSDTINFSVTSILGLSYQWKGPNNVFSSISKLFLSNLDTSYSGKYSLKVSEAKCTFLDENYSIIVHSNPILSITGVIAKAAINNPPIVLSGLPSGGILAGNGLAGNTFYPEKAGVGIHQIVYTYTDANKCSSNISSFIEVIDLPIDTPIAIKEIVTIQVYFFQIS